jgi:dTDP-4-dehydrorhamnose reductase
VVPDAARLVGAAARRDVPLMRALVTGAGGSLGRELATVLAASPAYDDVVALARADLDVTDAHAVTRAVAAAAPDVVVNAAAYTGVDAAETDEAAAAEVNTRAPALLAEACARQGALLVHVSTDYVFAGDAAAPYDVDAPVAPRTAYGRTKAAGEGEVRRRLPTARIVRTAWLYGAGGPSFVRTLGRRAVAGEPARVVDDQVGSPTWTRDLAERLALAPSAPPGTYHLAGAGGTTWFGLARAVYAEVGADPVLVSPCTTADMPRPAPRPAHSALTDRAWRAAGLPGMPGWRESLATAFVTDRQGLLGSD